MFTAVRRVTNAGTVTLNTVVDEVDAALSGKKVTLRFDPEAPPSRPVRVFLNDQEWTPAYPLDLQAHTKVKRSGLSFAALEADTPPRVYQPYTPR